MLSEERSGAVEAIDRGRPIRTHFSVLTRCPLDVFIHCPQAARHLTCGSANRLIQNEAGGVIVEVAVTVLQTQ